MLLNISSGFLSFSLQFINVKIKMILQKKSDIEEIVYIIKI